MPEEDADSGTCCTPGALINDGVRGLEQRSQQGPFHRQSGAGLGSSAKIIGPRKAAVRGSPASMTHEGLAGNMTSP